MEEVLTSSIIFWNMMLKTVLYQMETHAFSNVSTMFSRRTSAWSFSNLFYLIKEEQML